MRSEKGDRHPALDIFSWRSRFPQGREPVPIFLGRGRPEREPLSIAQERRNRPAAIFIHGGMVGPPADSSTDGSGGELAI
jgi:hypothetical protein